MARTLAEEVAALKRDVAQIKRGQRYAHGGSIENAALEVKDDTGSLRAIVGQQGDGTTAVNVVNGPVPPVPSAPTVEPALAALTVTWDGTFADAQSAPLDWMRVEVHVGPDAGFTPDQGTLRATIETPQGGSVVVSLPYTEWHVKLRSRTTSGTASDATAAVAGTPRKAETADIVAGSITADLIAVDAITGKTITGGTITGSLIQTAASGQRITINEADQNKVLLYNAAGAAIGELSYRGLLVQGSGGAVIWADPDSIYPTLRFYNQGQTNSAVINVVENTPGSANIGLNSGTFTSGGFTDWKWRTFFGEDFYVAERIRNSSTTTILGGRISLSATAGELTYRDTANPGEETTFGTYANRAQLSGGRLQVLPFASTSSAAYIEVPAAHTGNLLRLVRDGVDRATVDKDGNTTIAGVLSAPNIATGMVTITPSAAHTPTSQIVSGLNVAGTTFRAFATAATTVPGVRSPLGFAGVTGVSVAAVSGTGLTIYVNRENTTPTNVNWMVIGS